MKEKVNHRKSHKKSLKKTWAPICKKTLANTKKKQVGLFNSLGNVCAGCFDFSNLKMLLFCTNTMLKSDIQPAPSVLLAQKVQKVCTLSCLRRSQKGCYAMTEQHLSLQSFQSLILTFHCPSDHKFGQSPKV